MGVGNLVHGPGTVLQILFLNLILSGDNALVIALACRSLPQAQRARAIMAGTAVAILARIVLTMVVSVALEIPLLKLTGAVLLLAIAIKLLLTPEDQEAEPDTPPLAGSLASVVPVIIMADLAMSMDNVIAIAAVARDSMGYLVLGLLSSMPLLMVGSLFISRALQAYPELICAGSMMLGWIAGELAVSDPLVHTWIETQAPALAVAVPILCVVFVLCESRVVRNQLRLVGPPAFGPLFARRAAPAAAPLESLAPEPVLIAADAMAPQAVTAQIASTEANMPEPVTTHTSATEAPAAQAEAAQPSADTQAAGAGRPYEEAPRARPPAKANASALWSAIVVLCASVMAVPLIWIVMHWVTHD